MNYKFIPVNNDLNKAVAFANSLDQNYLRNVQKTKQKTFYVPTMEVLEFLQKEGWYVKGVDEHRAPNRKISSNYVQLHHPDFELKNNKGKMEAVSSLTISNSCNGNNPLTMNLGMYRQVCSNGMISFDQHAESTRIRHIETDYNNLPRILANVNSKVDKVLEQFGILQNKNLTVEEAAKFARQAAQLKFSNNDISETVINNLLAVNRIEDEGSDLWTVFNRIQENLTYDVRNMNDDIRLNQQLFSLAEQYAIAI